MEMQPGDFVDEQLRDKEHIMEKQIQFASKDKIAASKKTRSVWIPVGYILVYNRSMMKLEYRKAILLQR